MYYTLNDRTNKSKACEISSSHGGEYEEHGSTSQKILSFKSKAVPLDAIVALGGERRYSSYSFLSWAVDGSSGQRHVPAAP
jgi:hypothetical protein